MPEANVLAGEVTIIAHWRKLFRPILVNGRQIGKGKILSMEEAASTTCLQNNGYAFFGNPYSSALIADRAVQADSYVHFGHMVPWFLRSRSRHTQDDVQAAAPK